MTKQTVYIAGPMTGLPEFNFPAFDEAAAKYRALGYDVISPAEHDRDTGFDERGTSGDPDEAIALGFDKAAALLWDLEQVSKVDGIVLLPGWQRSGGVLAELALAATLDKWATEYALHEVCRRTGLTARDYMSARWNSTPEGDTPLAAWEVELLNVADETRVTNATTGGMKGSKLARFDLIPAGPLKALAEHYGKGAQKYASRNWELGTDWSLNFAALMRHAWAFWGGEDVDEETGSLHVTAVAWHAFALAQFMDTKPELDDRPKP